jgi:glutamate formiminotransferase
MEPPILLAVPNVSEGRRELPIAEISAAFACEGVRLLDVHRDGDHHRSVYTLAARPGELADGLLAGARVALEHVEVVERAAGGPSLAGRHPHVGALDVVPIVYLSDSARGAACAEALVVADRLGAELELPVFLYGELTRDESGATSTRATLRRGGVAGLTLRLESGEAPRPDFGPPRMHPSAGATLVAARPPLVAFNLQLAPPATVADARAIAARIREGGEHGLPGLRAMGVELVREVAQVSMNVEQPLQVPLARIVQAVRGLAPVASAELVGLAPLAALEGFPDDVPMPDFDPARHIIENALGC